MRLRMANRLAGRSVERAYEFSDEWSRSWPRQQLHHHQRFARGLERQRRRCRLSIRSALDAMRRSPACAATALITLALGIGATTAVFSIVRGVLLRPLPYADPDRLVRLWEEHPGGVSPAGNRWLSRPTYAV